MTQLQGFFEKNFTLSPDYCGASARMSPLAVFTMFQAIAAEHAERIGVGGAATVSYTHLSGTMRAPIR